MNPIIRASAVLAFSAIACQESPAPDGAVPAPNAGMTPQEEAPPPVASPPTFGEGCEFRALDVMAADEDEYTMDVFIVGDGEHPVVHPCWDRLSPEERAALGYGDVRPGTIAGAGTQCSLLFAPEDAVLRVTQAPAPIEGLTYVKVQGYAHPWMEEGSCASGIRRDAAFELSLETWCPTDAVLLVPDARLSASTKATEEGRRVLRDMRSAIRRNADFMTERRRASVR